MLKNFRMQADDLELFTYLQRELGGTQTLVLRRALRALASKIPRAKTAPR